MGLVVLYRKTTERKIQPVWRGYKTLLQTGECTRWRFRRSQQIIWHHPKQTGRHTNLSPWCRSLWSERRRRFPARYLLCRLFPTSREKRWCMDEQLSWATRNNPSVGMQRLQLYQAGRRHPLFIDHGWSGNPVSRIWSRSARTADKMRIQRNIGNQRGTWLCRTSFSNQRTLGDWTRSAENVCQTLSDRRSDTRRNHREDTATENFQPGLHDHRITGCRHPRHEPAHDDRCKESGYACIRKRSDGQA